MNKIFALIALLTLTPIMHADLPCESALASLIHTLNWERSYGSRNTIAYLERYYTTTLTKCTNHMSKEELYKVNKEYAQAQIEKNLKEADDNMKENYTAIASIRLKEVPKWEAVITELEKRESAK